MANIDVLKKELSEMAKYGSALALLGWDDQVYMPPAGRNFRGEVSALMSTDLHKRAISDKFVNLVKELKDPANFEKLNADDKVTVRETWRDLEKAIKIPPEFVEEFSILTTQAYGAWEEARKKSEYKIFQPYLEKIVQMKRKEADLVGYKDTPYNALLDDYEPELTAKVLDELFVPLAKDLSKLIKEVANKKQPSIPKKKYPIEIQKKLNEEILNTLGYDLDAGRLDISTHPFTQGFHPTDVRITTRYDENDFWVSVGSTIHEAGHGMYEQGLPTGAYGTPIGEAVSLGIHESQSRIWENMVGRSPEFCEYLNTLLVKYFKTSFTPHQLHSWLNRVEPNLIRVESDETTYNLHIILRYEIEKSLIEGDLEVGDLPAAWNAKVKEYLGLDVPDDTHGVLQDVHWSYGSIGYFPTYSLGNLYAAQLFNKAKSDIPNLEDGFSKAQFKPFLDWLRKNIHQEGGRYHAEELISKVTGELLNSKYLVDYLKNKQLHN
jgi:carboxypeptidase Taq